MNAKNILLLSILYEKQPGTHVYVLLFYVEMCGYNTIAVIMRILILYQQNDSVLK